MIMAMWSGSRRGYTGFSGYKENLLLSLYLPFLGVPGAGAG